MNWSPLDDDAECTATMTELMEFNKYLYTMLVNRTSGTAQLIVTNVADERNVMEAWRRLNQEYNPKTGASKIRKYFFVRIMLSSWEIIFCMHKAG